MRIPIHIAQKLLQLLKGEVLPSSVAKHAIIEELVSERIIERSGRIQKKLHLINRDALLLFLQNKCGINDLEEYIEESQKDNLKRSDLIKISSNSKLKSVRTFKGFLVNSYEPIQAELNSKSITLNFSDGVFQFIYDFESFIPKSTITIIGIENPENFRWIVKQKHLFNAIQPLFVCRYPQNQSKDLIKWLQSIPNNYMHFGDFDFAGIGIYLNEYKKYLGEKAIFFLPNNVNELINLNGNYKVYNDQKLNFKIDEIKEENILKLIQIIHKYKKGLEQELLISKEK